MLKPIVALALSVVAVLQVTIEPQQEGQLRRLFPSADVFSFEATSLPHFKAFMLDPRTRARTSIGLAFWTTDLDPRERGFEGPIKILVGMDLHGVLTGVIVAEHHEPYGDFSIERQEFAAQFKGKSIRDPFRVGSDVDAVSRASVSVASAARTIRNSARRAARELLPTGDIK